MKEICPNRRAKILDCGAGTGIMASQLASAGFSNIDALDPSAGMLKVAAKKNIYTEMYCEFLDENRLPISDNTYDACLLVGCVIPGHVNASCLGELIRITKSGGVIFLMTRERYLLEDPVLQQVEPAIIRLCADAKMEVLRREIIQNYYKDDAGILFICRVV